MLRLKCNLIHSLNFVIQQLVMFINIINNFFFKYNLFLKIKLKQLRYNKGLFLILL